MTGPITRIAAISAALSLALVVAACGDEGSDTDTASGDPLSKEEFIAQADEICESGDADIEQQALDLGTGTGVDPDTLVTTVIVPGTREQVEQIRELTPPEGDEDEIDEFLSTFDRGLDELENDPAILAKAKTIAEARSLAKDYGFDSCNTGGTASSQPSGIDVGGSAPAATGPKGRFIAQADQICAQTAARTEQTIQELVGGGAVKPSQLEEIAEITASGIEDQASGIRGLEVPEGDEGAVEAILAAAEEGAEEIRSDPESLSAGGVPNDSLDEANELAVDYGFTVCGNDN